MIKLQAKRIKLKLSYLSSNFPLTQLRTTRPRGEFEELEHELQGYRFKPIYAPRNFALRDPFTFHRNSGYFL